METFVELKTQETAFADEETKLVAQLASIQEALTDAVTKQVRHASAAKRFGTQKKTIRASDMVDINVYRVASIGQDKAKAAALETGRTIPILKGQRVPIQKRLKLVRKELAEIRATLETFGKVVPFPHERTAASD